MKKILLFIISAFLFSGLFAQSNLEFNRIVLVDSNVQTVPVGKVWKVESVLSGVSRQTFSPYFIYVNGKKTYFGDYNYGGQGWMDIAQIDILYKANGNCNSTPTLYFKYSGFEGKSVYFNRVASGTVQNSSSWHLVTTVSPQIAGNPLTFSEIYLYMTYVESGDARLVITYTDGSTSTQTMPGYSGTSLCQSGTYYFISTNPGTWSTSNQGPASVPESELFDLDTQLPFWLPEGTTLKAGNNVNYISIIEFNKN